MVRNPFGFVVPRQETSQRMIKKRPFPRGIEESTYIKLVSIFLFDVSHAIYFASK